MGRSFDSFWNTVYGYTTYKPYHSSNNMIIWRDPQLPYSNSFNASMIVKHKDGRYSNHIIDKSDSLNVIFNNMYFLRKFVCDVNYETLSITRKCIQPKIHIYLHDGRMFSIDGKCFVSFTNIDSNLIHKQSIYDVDKQIVYTPRFNYNSGIFQKEKNWQFFEQDNEVYMIYYINPFQVYKMDKTNFEVIEQVKHISWQFHSGLRCSAPPVFVDGMYYMPIHSKDYRMYIMTFDKSFNVHQITIDPLCDTKEGKCNYNIYFPCGIIYDKLNKSFLISMGIDDKVIGFMKISKNRVDSLLTPIH